MGLGELPPALALASLAQKLSWMANSVTLSEAKGLGWGISQI